MKYENVALKVGNTPLTFVCDFGNAKIWAKEEGCNPSGGIKDRLVFHLLSKMNLQEDAVLLEASSGTMASSVAFAAAALGIRACLVVNSKITEENKLLLTLLGAETIEFGSVTAESREHCFSLLAKAEKNFVFLDQLTNPDAPSAYTTLYEEIIADLCGEVSAIVGGMGSGATLLGLSRASRTDANVVSFFASVGDGSEPKKIPGTYLPGSDFETPFIKEITSEALLKDSFKTTYSQAMQHVRYLGQCGLFCGPAGGGAFSAAKQAIEKYNLSGNVVVILGDSGFKNLSRLK